MTNLIAEIHGAGQKAVLAITGGGSEAIGQLLQVPGGSRFLLEAIVPYSPAALSALLGSAPQQFCSEPTARAMAMAALERALRFADSEFDRDRLLGVACTASLASDRPKLGAHRCHVAYQCRRATASVSIELAKGRRDRAGEEDLTARLILRFIRDALGLDPEAIELPLLPGESLLHNKCHPAPEWIELLFGPSPSARPVPVNPQAKRSETNPAIFPGAFHPRHAGHLEMARIAREELGRPVEYELSVVNVDKLPLDYVEMRHRAAQFAEDEVLWFTRAPRFVDKAQLFPGATFVVGIDTLGRIGDPRYYENDVEQRDAAIDLFEAQRCRFLVFGRLVKGAFCRLDTLEVPANLKKICREVPEDRFRVDLSSTGLREAMDS